MPRVLRGAAIDEDMPEGLAEAVLKVVPDTLTVIDEGLSGILDPGLWEIVQKEQRLLITGDKAFANMRKYPPGTHAGILGIVKSGRGRIFVGPPGEGQREEHLLARFMTFSRRKTQCPEEMSR